VVAVAVAVWVSQGRSGPGYRLTAVSIGTVAATLDEVGTIQPVNQANLGFDTSGTIGSIAVTVGQAVTAGETIAALDTAPLQANVTIAQAALATAQAKLAADEASETAAVQTAAATTPPSGGTSAVASGGSTSSGGGVSAAGAGSSGPSSGAGGQSGAVTSDQTTLLADQKQADADQQKASTDLASAATACQSGVVSTGHAVPASTVPASTVPASTVPASTVPASTVPATPPTTGSATTCLAALQQAEADQRAVARAQAAVSTDESQLAATLSKVTSTPGTGQITTAVAGVTRSSGSQSGGQSGSQSGASASAPAVATPEQLASDQAAVDVADAQLAEAQQNLASADLTSPIAGTVASVSVAVGDAVSATSSSGSSSKAAFVILAPGAYEATTSVPVAQIADVKVGEPAVITPDTTGVAVDGSVTSIGLLPTTSSSGTASYPVDLAISSGTGLQLLSGADAQISIVTKSVSGAITVPTSAVHTVGATHLVTMMDHGTVTSRRVVVGIVGDLLTQVVSGLTPGEQVVLADLATPLPTSSITATRAFDRGVGASGGAGAFGGGATARSGG